LNCLLRNRFADLEGGWHLSDLITNLLEKNGQICSEKLDWIQMHRRIRSFIAVCHIVTFLLLLTLVALVLYDNCTESLASCFHVTRLIRAFFQGLKPRVCFILGLAAGFMTFARFYGEILAVFRGPVFIAVCVMNLLYLARLVAQADLSRE
jgi:hypothetical protein